MLRSPSPPLIEDPIDDGEGFGWYYDTDAGGMILPFAKYPPQTRMHSVSLSYLRFCREHSHKPSFLAAFDKYQAGLYEHVQKGYNYENVFVPFGTKHRGARLRQCRDKGWLEWCQKQKYLTDKHPLFFVAVEKWLANPRKWGKMRDVGELLAPSEYKDDLDLAQTDDASDDVSEFADFIDDSGYVSNHSSTDDESDVEQGTSSGATTHFDEEQEERSSDDGSGSQEGAREIIQQARTPTKSGRARKAKQAKHRPGKHRQATPGIVSEESDGGEDSYAETEASDNESQGATLFLFIC
ncbi:hypothetical protein C8J57DRAFT_6390 [Mycena rebaudengoi]|nr:hypothetical protein C8J57DRAFT_6390 [Mycena rebaudengoi]